MDGEEDFFDEEAFRKDLLEYMCPSSTPVGVFEPTIYTPLTNPHPVFGDSRFELFDIQIKHSQNSLSEIWIDDLKGVEHIYEAPNIPMGESLSLIGPSKSCKICDYPIYICFGGHSWYFGIEHPRPSRKPDAWVSKDCHVPVEWNTPMAKFAYDKIGSEAIIRFELIKDAAIASLEFQFVSEKEKVGIEIKDGVITATHNRNQETRRFIRQFGAKNIHLSQKRKANDNLLDLTKQMISLDRSVFAVPIDGELNVSVDLTYDVKGTSTIERTMKSTLNFKVPEAIPTNLNFVEQFFPNFSDEGAEFPKLGLKIFWSDPRADYV